VAAALGAITLVFQSEAGARMMGLPSPLDGIVPSIPLLALCGTFGVGLDYEVLLLARVSEERRAGASNEQAIIEGLARSADVIVRAAVIMIGVFAAFAVSDFVVLEILGVALAVAITLDVTLIRLVAAPALLYLARRWNWWPGERGSPEARP
jgi:RND superfamily putative drug exporter